MQDRLLYRPEEVPYEALHTEHKLTRAAKMSACLILFQYGVVSQWFLFFCL